MASLNATAATKMVKCAIVAFLVAAIMMTQSAVPSPCAFVDAVAGRRLGADPLDELVFKFPAMPEWLLQILDKSANVGSLVMKRPASLLATEQMHGEKQEETLHQRSLYYGLDMAVVAGLGSILTSAILKGGNAIKSRGNDAGYAPVSQESRVAPSSPAQEERSFLREKVLAGFLFSAHVAVMVSVMWPAALRGELSGDQGLSWRRWLEALTMGMCWLVAQALIRAVWTSRREAFGWTVGPMAAFGYLCPILSDGYDTLKDVIFSAVCVAHGGLWRRVGAMSLLWLVGIHLTLVGCDHSAQAADSILATYAAVIFASVVSDDTKLTLREEGIIVVFKQTTSHKRNLILLEDLPQGIACLAFVRSTRNSAGFPVFVFVNNVVLPLVKFLFAVIFQQRMARLAIMVLSKQAKIALDSGNPAKVAGLMTTLLPVLEDLLAGKTVIEKEFAATLARLNSHGLLTLSSTAMMELFSQAKTAAEGKGDLELASSLLAPVSAWISSGNVLDNDSAKTLSEIISAGVDIPDHTAEALVQQAKAAAEEKPALTASLLSPVLAWIGFGKSLEESSAKTLAEIFMIGNFEVPKKTAEVLLEQARNAAAEKPDLSTSLATTVCCAGTPFEEHFGEPLSQVISAGVTLPDRAVMELLKKAKTAAEGKPQLTSSLLTPIWASMGSGNPLDEDFATALAEVFKVGDFGIPDRAAEVLLQQASTNCVEKPDLSASWLTPIWGCIRSGKLLNEALTKTLAEICVTMSGKLEMPQKTAELLLEQAKSTAAEKPDLAASLLVVVCAWVSAGNSYDEDFPQIFAAGKFEVPERTAEVLLQQVKSTAAGKPDLAASLMVIIIEQRLAAGKVLEDDLVAAMAEVAPSAKLQLSEKTCKKLEEQAKKAAKEDKKPILAAGLLAPLVAPKKELVLGAWQLGDDGVAILCKALESPNCLVKTVELFKNNIGPDGATAIGKALQSPNCKVTSMGLANNNLGPTGATSIGEALQSPNCKVTSMGLHDNNLGPTGATSIAEALAKKDCKVREMGLSENNIGDEGANAIAQAFEEALPKEQKLEISLPYNGIGEAGQNALRQAVQGKNIQLDF